MASTAITPGRFRVAGKKFPKVDWLMSPNLRVTYALLLFVVLASATNGYDGSMANGLLSLERFTKCMNNPLGSIKASSQFLCSLLTLPLTPYISDGLGQRWDICIGTIIIIFTVVL
ncbi:hypothetical protein CC80DRAFT_551671 [Byssothecium circinans]|uniref:Major facilitator superfamily (MFS) profile domain-containing protein n=1 Tax=Byssothecium circinans TaxID=147558 RepID=A0A6A5TVL0_9PLEO|nr:hypothetical protein CC80DRAFT_551671 [Byssothecium circinans]